MLEFQYRRATRNSEKGLRFSQSHIGIQLFDLQSDISNDDIR